MNRVKNGLKPGLLYPRFIRVLMAIIVLHCIQQVTGNGFERIFAQESGYIRVETEPKESNVYLDGELVSSLSPVEMDNIQHGDHMLEIENVKYEFNTQVNISLNSEFNSLVIKVSYYFGTIDISTNSQKAGIEMDGVKVGLKEFSGTLANPRSVININSEIAVDPVLTPAIIGGGVVITNPYVDKGSLSVHCYPSDAEIFVDGVSKGNLPDVIEDISVGNHEVMIARNGFQTYNQSVEILAGQTYNMEVELSKQYYTIRLGSEPSGAQVFFNGEFKGLTPVNILAESGQHKIRLVHEDFDEMNETIEVYSENNLNYNLEVQSAEIEFLSSPSRVNVLVDGKSIGNTPVSSDLRLGYTSLTFQKKGFEPLIKEYKVAGDFEYNVVLYPIKYRKKPVALLGSLLWPGAGQSYLKRGSWHLVFGLAGYGSLVGWQSFQGKAYDSYDQYIAETDPYEREQLKTEFQDYDSKSTYFLIGAGIIWGANLLWTAIMPDEEKHYRRLELNAFYDENTPSPQIGLAINF